MKKWICAIVLIMTVTVQAQSGRCSAIVELALDAVDRLCQDVARNQACYGNIALTAQPAAEVTDLAFDSPGDIESLPRIASLSLSGLDETNNSWGIALMKVQANLPDTIPGQNVTVLLFGDVQINNSTGTMDSFYLQTGIGDAACAEMPDSGVLLQTPQGVGEIQLTVNGIEIQMGSTLYLRAAPQDAMYVSVLEGSAQVTAKGVTRDVPTGSNVLIPLDGNLEPAAPPLPVRPFDSTSVQALPVSLLPVTLASAVEPSPVVTPAVVSGSPVYHTVQRGENLFRIALYYDTSIQSIADANGLADPRQIYAGQVLLIPNPGSGYRGLPSGPLLPPAGAVATPGYRFVPSEGGYIHHWDNGQIYTYNLQNVDPGRTFYLNTELGNFLFTVDNTNPRTFYGRTYDNQLITLNFTSVMSYTGCGSWYDSCFRGGQ